MKTHADKTQEHKNKPVANSIARKQNSGQAAFGFADNRPEAVTRKQLQESISDSPRVKQLKALQKMTHNNPRTQSLLQLQARVQEHAQHTDMEKKEPVNGKSATPSSTQVAQRTVHGNKIDFTFNSPPSLIEPVFSSGNNVFGASRFYYGVTFNVDEQGTQGTDDYRIGEFRQYYKDGVRVFGQKHEWEDDWVEDTLSGNDHYGYRNANTHASKYFINENAGDRLEMQDKPEIQGVNKPDEIAYDQLFKGEVVAVDGPGGNVKEVLKRKEWRVKGMGTRDEKGNIYYGISHGQLKDPKPKSANKSKRQRKEAAGKYKAPTPNG